MTDGYDVYEISTGHIHSHENNLDDAMDLWRRLEKDDPGVYWIKETEI